jgi:hypothetical protein
VRLQGLVSFQIHPLFRPLLYSLQEVPRPGYSRQHRHYLEQLLDGCCLAAAARPSLGRRVQVASAIRALSCPRVAAEIAGKLKTLREGGRPATRTCFQNKLVPNAERTASLPPIISVPFPVHWFDRSSFCLDRKSSAVPARYTCQLMNWICIIICV